MKNTNRAKRRHKCRSQFNRLLAELFAVNTAYDTKAEMTEVIHKRNYCEQVGRRGIILSLKRPTPPNEANL